MAGLTAAANAVVNAVNLEYNDWSGDAAAKTEKDPNSRYKHLKYVESSVVIHCYVYRRRFFDLSFITIEEIEDRNSEIKMKNIFI